MRIAITRFTIRDMLWLTVVVGVCCAWLLCWERETGHRAILQAENERLAVESKKTVTEAKATITLLEARLYAEEQRRRTSEEKNEKTMEATVRRLMDEQSKKLDWRFPVYYPK
jgi:hypothetical protein